MVTLTPLEQRAYELIKKYGDKGILQSELWKRLGLDSKEGSRITLRLLKKGFIQREPVIHAGRKTYKLIPLRKVEEEIRVDGFIDVPCFACTEHIRCSDGGYLNPATCPKLSLWLMYEANRIESSTIKAKVLLETLSTQ